MLLFDAQTSGGLLLALSKQNVERFLDQAEDRDMHAWPIGEVEEGRGIQVLDTLYRTDLHRGADLWFSPPASTRET
jgi:hypothetical protein